MQGDLSVVFTPIKNSFLTLVSFLLQATSCPNNTKRNTDPASTTPAARTA
jgi:hypothetical protein